MTHPLRAWRESRAMSRAELARLAAITERTVFRVERGDVVPSLETAAEIERATEHEITATTLRSAASEREAAKQSNRAAAKRRRAVAA